MFNASKLELVFDYIGADLAARGARVEILVVGGGSLLLLGVIQRPTQDVDVVAIKESAGFVRAETLPTVLEKAVLRVQALMKRVLCRALASWGVTDADEWLPSGV